MRICLALARHVSYANGGHAVYHTTVLRDRVIELAASVPRLSRCIDATLGDGGHSLALLEHSRRVRVIGIDCDAQMIDRARQRLRKYSRRMRYAHSHYDDYLTHYSGRVQFVLFDLGISMTHIADSGRGFTFMDDQPLDMRFDVRQQSTAATIIDSYSASELQHIFAEYGQERHAARIAQAVVAQRRQRPIVSTKRLAEIVIAALPPAARRGSTIHPATQSISGATHCGQRRVRASAAGAAAGDRGRGSGRHCGYHQLPLRRGPNCQALL